MKIPNLKLAVLLFKVNFLCVPRQLPVQLLCFDLSLEVPIWWLELCDLWLNQKPIDSSRLRWLLVMRAGSPVSTEQSSQAGMQYHSGGVGPGACSSFYLFLYSLSCAIWSHRPQGQTGNARLYCSILRHLRENIEQKYRAHWEHTNKIFAPPPVPLVTLGSLWAFPLPLNKIKVEESFWHSGEDPAHITEAEVQV